MVDGGWECEDRRVPERPTRDRILDEAVDLFGFRGVEAVSLDEIARAVGVRKQSVLYWFPSKEALVAAVLDTVADELVVVITAAIRASDDDPLVRIDAVIRAVFGPAVRRPALLGLVRELGRLDPELVERLRSRVAPPSWRPVCGISSRRWSVGGFDKQTRGWWQPSPTRQ